jgi:hypothetical protein
MQKQFVSAYPSTNSCSIISSSLEDEVKPLPIKLKGWLEVEVMILAGK